MPIREYAVENEDAVDISELEAGWMPDEGFIAAHEHLVIPCHDAVLEYEGGALLIVRDNVPVKGELWPLGGRISRGVPTGESLKRLVKKESNLEISDIVELATVRSFYRTDPFGRGKGTDNITVWYFAQGYGNLRLDRLHERPTIVMPEDYKPAFRESLHPYVRDYMDLVMPLIKDS